MEKIGHRYVIQYLHLKGLSPTNIKAELDYTLEESAPSFTTIKYWVAEFKRGGASCQDEHRSGWPNEVIAIEMVKKIHKVVLEYRRLKVRELADMEPGQVKLYWMRCPRSLVHAHRCTRR